MLETLLNGRLDAWWEWVIIIVVAAPVWGAFLYVLAHYTKTCVLGIIEVAQRLRTG